MITVTLFGIDKVRKNSINFIEYVYLVDSLKYNLLSISQLCDKDNCLWFDDSQCVVENARTNGIVLHGSRLDNVYVVSPNYILSYASFMFKSILC